MEGHRFTKIRSWEPPESDQRTVGMKPRQTAKKALPPPPCLKNGPAPVNAPAGPGGSGKASPFPARGDHGPTGTVAPSATKASARPGGCEAPAMGGAGAGRGLWPPAGVLHAHRMAGAMAPAKMSGGCPLQRPEQRRGRADTGPDMGFRENNPTSGRTQDRPGHGRQAIQRDGQHCLLTV
jgi:hypothetical protein